MNDTVNIRPLKAIAIKLEDPLKTLILSEPDTIPREEYLIKIQSWLRILNLDKKEEPA
jgi:hypothetical protein